MHKILKEFVSSCDYEIEKLLKAEMETFKKTGGFTSAGASNIHLLMENREHAKEMLEEEIKETGVKEHAYDEIKGAEEYCSAWVRTGDPAYKTMAADELRHAEFFTKQIEGNLAAKTDLEQRREAVLVKLNSSR